MLSIKKRRVGKRKKSDGAKTNGDWGLWVGSAYIIYYLYAPFDDKLAFYEEESIFFYLH